MDIHFIRGGRSYLPELSAYDSWLTARGHRTFVHDTPEAVPPGPRVVWWICGRVARSAAARLDRAFHVHEYASASVPPAAWWKDRVKHWAHPRPQHRVFQSDWVRRRLGFGDAVPFSLRDMGVPRAFLEAKASAAPEFDLAYLGETSRLATFAPALEELDEAGLSLLVVGTVERKIADFLRRLRNVRCIGRLAQGDVPAQLLRARAGLNLVPNRRPFNEQTSTKALEYLALGLPVVSNDYPWIRRLAIEHPHRVRALASFDGTSWGEALRKLPPREEDRSRLANLTWEARLLQLPVWEAIERWEEGQ